MTFAVPIAFALAALALPIIGFYILKVRLRRVPTSTNLFWKQIFDEKPPRSLWQNFRHLLSLLLQLLMLILLVLSIADPYFAWQLFQARRIVLVIDNSASMRAADVAPSRFEAARAEAKTIVDSLRFRDELAIVLAGKHPQVIVGMTNHSPTLRRALQGLSVSDTSTELQPAIELGKQLLGKHPHGQVIVLSDGQGVNHIALTSQDIQANQVPNVSEDAQNKPASSDDKPNDERVAYRLFYTSANNVGITQFQVRRSLIDPIGYEILVEVKNASSEPMECRLELTLDEAPIDVLPLKLQPDETWGRSIEKTSLEGGRLTATLTKLSDLKLNQLLTDDTAWGILPARKVQKVLIVTAGNLFLQKVFEANPLVQIRVVKELPSEWPADTLIVLHRMLPAVLPSGNVMVIDPTTACDAWELGGVLDNPIVTEQDKSSPLMTHIRLDNVLMPESRQLVFHSTPHVLAGVVTGESVYSEVKRANGKCLVLSVNLESSDLAFRTAFPILVTNALGWFAGNQGELRESIATGAIVSVERENIVVPKSMELRSPTGALLPFQPMRGENNIEQPSASSTETQNTQTHSTFSGQIGPLDETGIWSIVAVSDANGAAESAELEPLYEVAVNLASSLETELRTTDELRASSTEQIKSAKWFTRPVWFYLVFLACLLTTTEWFLHQRRWIT